MRTPNQRNRYAKLKGRLNKYSLAVQNIYDLLNVEAAKIATGTGFAGGVFRFSDYPMTADAVNRLQERFVREMRGLIYSGTSAEWKESNLVQDLLANDVLRSYGATIHGEKTKVYYQKNSDALRAFQERTERGMNLSTKLWNQSSNYKQELEYAISSAIEKGTSAVTLSKQLSKYLHDFPSLKADYKERFGQAVTCQDCEYRSIRLARTEINMAYRTAEQTRWKQMDFVVGFEVKLSFSHEITDICDSAQGKYPKDFVFMGWHPNCMCYTIPILKTESEFWSGDTSAPGVNEVTDVPTGFKQWVQDNQERLAFAEQRGTLPYWYSDNRGYANDYAVETSYSSIFSPIASYYNSAISQIGVDIISEREALSILEQTFRSGGYKVRGEFDGFYIDRMNLEESMMRTIPVFDENGNRRNRIYISNNTLRRKTQNGETLVYNPMFELRCALTAIQRGVPLTFGQEYSIESVWHEIRHAQAKGWSQLLKDKDHEVILRTSMETVNQFCARRTYGGFLRKLGATPINEQLIISSGYGYGVEVRNFEALLERCGISSKEAFSYLDHRFKENYSEMVYTNIRSLLERHGVKRESAKMLVDRLSSSNKSFRTIMDDILS